MKKKDVARCSEDVVTCPGCGLHWAKQREQCPVCFRLIEPKEEKMKTKLKQCAKLIDKVHESIDKLLDILPFKKDYGDILVEMADTLNKLSSELLKIYKGEK